MNEKYQIQEILNGLTNSRSAVEKQLSKYPEGELRVRKQVKNGKIYTTLFLEHKQEKGEIRKSRSSITSNNELVQIMARKKYLQEKKNILDSNIEALQTAYELIENSEAEDILMHLDPEIRSQIEFNTQTVYRLPDDPKAANVLLKWVQEPSLKNPNYPEYLKHRTSTGELVRSKSEMLVYEKLKEYGIAFKYELPKQIGDTVFYPDFTIMRTDGKLFYWEHAGRCDLQSYRDEILWKTRMFESVGIGQWDNLIITYDTGDGQIDLREIEFIIKNKLIIE